MSSSLRALLFVTLVISLAPQARAQEAGAPPANPDEPANFRVVSADGTAAGHPADPTSVPGTANPQSNPDAAPPADPKAEGARAEIRPAQRGLVSRTGELILCPKSEYFEKMKDKATENETLAFDLKKTLVETIHDLAKNNAHSKAEKVYGRDEILILLKAKFKGAADNEKLNTALASLADYYAKGLQHYANKQEILTSDVFQDKVSTMCQGTCDGKYNHFKFRDVLNKWDKGQTDPAKQINLFSFLESKGNYKDNGALADLRKAERALLDLWQAEGFKPNDRCHTEEDLKEAQAVIEKAKDGPEMVAAEVAFKKAKSSLSSASNLQATPASHAELLEEAKGDVADAKKQIDAEIARQGKAPSEQATKNIAKLKAWNESLQAGLTTALAIKPAGTPNPAQAPATAPAMNADQELEKAMTELKTKKDLPSLQAFHQHLRANVGHYKSLDSVRKAQDLLRESAGYFVMDAQTKGIHNELLNGLRNGLNKVDESFPKFNPDLVEPNRNMWDPDAPDQEEDSGDLEQSVYNNIE